MGFQLKLNQVPSMGSPWKTQMGCPHGPCMFLHHFPPFCMQVLPRERSSLLHSRGPCGQQRPPQCPRLGAFDAPARRARYAAKKRGVGRHIFCAVACDERIGTLCSAALLTPSPASSTATSSRLLPPLPVAIRQPHLPSSSPLHVSLSPFPMSPAPPSLSPFLPPSSAHVALIEGGGDTTWQPSRLW